MSANYNARLEQLRADTDEAFPRRDGEPLPLWLRRAMGEGHICRRELDNLLAHYSAEIVAGPTPEDEADEERFALHNDKARPAPWKPEPPERKRQRVLLAGLDCLPGQRDLFGTDGELTDDKPAG